MSIFSVIFLRKKSVYKMELSGKRVVLSLKRTIFT